MMVLSDSSFAGRCLSWGPVAAGLLLAMIGGTGCRSERRAGAVEADVVTQVQMLRPASDRVAVNAAPPAQMDSVDEWAEYCRQVERQARDTNASLPKRLDKDTSATRVVAYGCDVVLEYAMLDLRVGEVALEGVRALRSDVLDKLCSDHGARGVLEHGGSFTNVYRDDESALIDQFTIAEADCWDRRSANGAPARIDL